MWSQQKIYHPLIIVGGGPGGLTAALYAERLGLEYLLVDKEGFPKDKVCGDALAPPVFTILEDLGIPIGSLLGMMHSPDRIVFSFSHAGNSTSLENVFSDHSRAWNCRRLDFDNFLFGRLKAKDNFVKGKLREINAKSKQITITRSAGDEEVLKYGHLLLATGSGKLMHSHQKEVDRNIIMASRFYVKSRDTAHPYSLLDFSDDISPGYFWSFPFGNDIYNTGVLLHQHDSFHQLYQIHEQKLQAHFPSCEIISRDKFPLRVHPDESGFSDPCVAVIGDAHHSIDPLFGHGIDTAMLEAREQVMSLKHTGGFAQQSEMLESILHRNAMSAQYRDSFHAAKDIHERVEVFVSFLNEMSVHHAKAISLIYQTEPIKELDQTVDEPQERFWQGWMGKLRKWFLP